MVKEKDKKKNDDNLKEKIQKAVEEADDDFEEVTIEDRIISIEKKLTAVIVMLIIVIVMSFIMIIANSSNDSESETDSTDNTQEVVSADYDVSMFDEIKASDIESESKNKTIVVYMGRSTCSHCIDYVPVLANVSEETGVKIKYIDMAKIIDYSNSTITDSEAISTLQNLSTNDAQKDVMDNLGSTPMTLIIKNNKIIDSLLYAADEDAVKTLLENNGLGK